MTEIRADGVTKRFGSVTALDDLSLSIDGGLVGLLGSNGAGKTTLFKLLVGLDRPDAGSLSVDGEDPSRGTAVRRRVGYLPEDARFAPKLTGREVVTFHARVRGVPADRRDRRVEQVLGVVGLAGAADRAVGGYSNGMTRRLGLAAAIVADPDVLLLDEPTAGLDPRGLERFHTVLEGLAEGRDLTVLVASHALAEIERLCERVVVMHDGRVVESGPVDGLRQAAAATRVIATYDDEATAEAAAAAVRDRPDVERVETDGTRLTVETGAAYALVQALHDAAEPTSFEVTEPGLGAVYEAAIGGEPA